MSQQLPAIMSKWYSPQGILMEVVDIHTRPKTQTFITFEIVATKRRVLRDLVQFQQFKPAGAAQ